MASRVLYACELGVVGEFVCRAGDAAWRRTNDIGGAVHLVYPRTCVVISQIGHRSVLATPNHVMIYSAHQRYRRQVADPSGDHCYFLRVEPEREDELLADVPDGTLPAPALPLDALTYLLAYRLADRLCSGDALDALELEEAIAALARRSLTNSRRHCRRPRREHRHALAEAAKRYLAETFRSRGTLGEIGRALHVSPWHLARIFREETGFTLHAYRQQMRLRQALQLVSDGADLTETALAVGFSSHSHLTTAFSRAFGRPPSCARIAELRTIVEAGAAASS